MSRQRLKLARIDRVALVDRGDNPEANVLISKRAPDAPTDPTAPAPAPPARTSAPDGLMKWVLAAVGSMMGKAPADVQKAYDEAKTFGELDQSRRMNAAISETWDLSYQWQQAVSSTLRDGNITEEERATLIATSNTQFFAAAEAARLKWVKGETAAEVAKAEAATCPDCKKSVGDDGTCPDCGKKVEKKGAAMSAARLTRLREAHTNLTAILAEVDSSTTEEVPVAEPTTEKSAPPAPAGIDEVLKTADPAVQALFKAQQAALDKAQADATSALEKLAGAEEARALDGFRKRLDKGGDLHGLPGQTAENLRALQKSLPADAWAAQEAVMKGAAVAIQKGGLFAEIGSSSAGTPGSGAMAQLSAAADEIRKAQPTLTPEQAMAKAQDDNPALVKAYREEMKGGL